MISILKIQNLDRIERIIIFQQFEKFVKIYKIFVKFHESGFGRGKSKFIIVTCGPQVVAHKIFHDQRYRIQIEI